MRRHSRRSEKEWTSIRSCTGGIPAIDERHWPVNGGRKTSCLLRIDLEELSAIAPLPNGQTKGTLLFFGTADVYGRGPMIAVRYLDHRVGEAEEGPEKLSPLSNGYDAPDGYMTQQASPVPLPRWPLTFHRVTEDENGQVIEGEARRQPLMPKLDLTDIAQGDALTPFPGRAARFLLDEVARALAEDFKRDKPRLLGGDTGQFGRETPAQGAACLRAWRESLTEADPILDFLETWSDPVTQCDPWAPLGPTIGEPMVRDFEALVSSWPLKRRLALFPSCRTLVRLATHMAAFMAYRLMFTGSRRQFAQMPEAAVDAIRALDAAGSMFGFGSTLQDWTYEHAEDVLLLQTSHDPLSGIAFGNGAFLHVWHSEQNFQEMDFFGVKAALEAD